MGACYSMDKREPNIGKTRGEPDTGSEEKSLIQLRQNGSLISKEKRKSSEDRKAAWYGEERRGA